MNPRRISELLKCQVLCYNCHLEKANKEKALGEANGQSRLTASQVREVRALRQKGFLYRELATLFGISPSVIGGICRRETWKHVA